MNSKNNFGRGGGRKSGGYAGGANHTGGNHTGGNRTGDHRGAGNRSSARRTRDGEGFESKAPRDSRSAYDGKKSKSGAQGERFEKKDRRPPTRQGPGNGPKPDAFRRHDKESRPRVRIHLFGFHAVSAALSNPNRTVHHIYATEQTELEAMDMVARAAQIRDESGGDALPQITLLERENFDRALPKGTVHQGIGIDCDPLQDVFMTDLIHQIEGQKNSVVVLLDQISDPHNLGAIMRSACAFGADAIIVQNRHTPELNAVVAKIASGAMEHLPVIYETNLARAIETLQDHGFFAVALDERGEKTLAQTPHYDRVVLVLGAEGQGLRPLVRNKCDLMVKLPTGGALSSLNVSNAAAIALYEVHRSSTE